MQEEKKETTGAASIRLMEKAADNTHTAIDQMREQLTDYDKNLELCVATHKKTFPDNFYVVVITKKERLMQNVLRGYFTARISCPTPDYDQAVYKYHREADSLEFLWVLPSQFDTQLMAVNAHLVPPEQYELLSYCLRFRDGSLMDFAKKENKEIT